jgi:4-carboxymuconolactone decarboxylase
MADASDDRLARALETAAKLFPPGAPGSPRFKYPAEIEADWNRFSLSTVFGDVWSRPGLELKQRAMLAIAALTALNRPEQLRAYITAGLNTGLTRSEVCEIILQMAVYAGFPAAIQGFAVANEVFQEFDRAAGQP